MADSFMKDTPESKRLIADLERRIAEADPYADLAECHYAGDGEFLFKLYTAAGGYLSSGTAEDIVSIVKEDLAAATNAVCPFCKHKLGHDNHHGCSKCGAVADCQGRQLAERLLTHLDTPDDILGAICAYPGNYRETPKLHSIWASRKTDTVPNDLAEMVHAISGPSQALVTFPIPVLILVDEVISEEEKKRLEQMENIAEDDFDCDLMHLPSCHHCIHAAHLDDCRQGYRFHFGPEPVCVYPHTGKAFQALFPEPFELQNERGPHYSDNDDALFRNTLLSEWLGEDIGVPGSIGLLVVDAQDDRTRAYVGAPFNQFHGPICPNFSLNRDHPDLTGEIYAPCKTTVDVTMGVVDMEKRKAEAKQQHYEDVVDAASTHLRAMAKDPAKQRILRTRIEKANFHEMKEPLFEVLSELDPELWQLLSIWPDSMRFHLNISNSVAMILPEQMRHFLLWRENHK